MIYTMVLKTVSIHMDKKNDNEHYRSSNSVLLYFLEQMQVSGVNVNVILLSQFPAKLSYISGIW